MPTVREKLFIILIQMDATPLANDSSIVLPDTLLDILECYDCIVFAGNIGSTAIETIVDAALLIKIYRNVKLVIA